MEERIAQNKKNMRLAGQKYGKLSHDCLFYTADHQGSDLSVPVRLLSSFFLHDASNVWVPQSPMAYQRRCSRPLYLLYIAIKLFPMFEKRKNSKSEIGCIEGRCGRCDSVHRTSGNCPLSAPHTPRNPNNLQHKMSDRAQYISRIYLKTNPGYVGSLSSMKNRCSPIRCAMPVTRGIHPLNSVGLSPSPTITASNTVSMMER